MRIISMTATFGRLEKAHLDFGPGLNLIQAPNESGKSTWCAFWKAMLYGINTRQSDKKGLLADKNRYQPWSGAAMEGELVLEWQGQSITIRRGPKGTTPFGAFSAVYTDTGDPVSGMTAQNCGEMLTGVGREVFERSALLGAGNLNVTSAPELEKRIASLVASGQEDLSLSETESRLKEWMNRRKVNRSVGQIPKLEEQIAQADQTLAGLHSLCAEISALEEQQGALERCQATLNSELEVHRQLARKSLDDRFTQADAELDRAQRQLAALERESARFGQLPSEERLRKAQGDLQYLRVLNDEIKNAETALKEADDHYVQAQRNLLECTLFTGMTDEEAAQKVHRDLAEYKSCSEAVQNHSAKLFPVFGAVAALALVILGTATKTLPLMLVLALAALGFSVYTWHRSSKGVESRRRRAQQILTRWSVSSPGELEDALTRFHSLSRVAQAAADQAKTARGAVNDYKARQENTRSGLIDFVHTFAPEIHDLFGCSAALSRALSLDHDLALARDRVQERMARLDDLASQGGQTETSDPGIAAPRHTMQQCRELLARLDQELKALSETLNQARGRQSSLGDPAAIAAQREKLAEELSQRRNEQAALEYAMETIQTAGAQLRQRFSPDLNRLASGYFSRLTGEKYESLTLNRDMEGEAARSGDILPHSALYLSRGTLDQLYLAVRLAVCELCLPEKPPVVLDDAFTAFDDERLKLAMDLVRELAAQQQLLLFTCHSREGSILGENDVNRLELN